MNGKAWNIFQFYFFYVGCSIGWWWWWWLNHLRIVTLQSRLSLWDMNAILPLLSMMERHISCVSYSHICWTTNEWRWRRWEREEKKNNSCHNDGKPFKSIILNKMHVLNCDVFLDPTVEHLKFHRWQIEFAWIRKKEKKSRKFLFLTFARYFRFRNRYGYAWMVDDDEVAAFPFTSTQIKQQIILPYIV